MYDEQAAHRACRHRVREPFEKEYHFRKDGSCVSVLVAGAVHYSRGKTGR